MREALRRVATADDRRARCDHRWPDPSNERARRLQQSVGNRAVAARLAPVLARVRTSDQVLATPGLSLSAELVGEFGKGLQEVDRLVGEHAGLAGQSPQLRNAKLIEIEAAVYRWRDADKTDEKTKVADVFLGEVLEDKRRVALETKRLRIDTRVPGLLDGPPKDAPTLFKAFMDTFRGSAYTTTSKAQPSLWEGGGGPFACATFARAFADLAQSAGLKAEVVEIGPKNFLTPVLDADFVDPSAKGNVQVKGWLSTSRERRYFFSKHFVTKVGDQYFCPTSGKALSGKDAPEVVDRTFGQLMPKSGADRTYVGGKNTVSWVGYAEDGGGLYTLSVGLFG